jgi:hypothetical protein
MSLLRNVNITTQDSAAIDAFGRFRVSEPYTLFDSKNIFDDSDLASNVENQPLFFDNAETSGSGTSTLYNTNQASQELIVSANTAGQRARQTKMRFNYQAGKSLLSFLTFNLLGQQAGITKREGLFDSNNGIFLELNGASNVYFVIRSNTSGTPVDSKYIRSIWNVDKMDGSGPSGVNLDFTKTQIMIIDYEWLGVGRCRIGFVVSGNIYYAHYANHSNLLSVVYMSTPNLPIRSEITNDGTGVQSSMTQICSTVISEGGIQDNGQLRYISTGGVQVSCTTENIVYAIVGIRKKTNYIGTSINIQNIALQIQNASKKLEWVLLLNPTVAGTFTYTDNPLSAMQYALGATANTVTNGYKMAGGWAESGGIQSGSSGSASSGIDNAIRLGSTIAGVRDTMVLCVRPVGGSTDVEVEGSIQWRELA